MIKHGTWLLAFAAASCCACAQGQSGGYNPAANGPVNAPGWPTVGAGQITQPSALQDAQAADQAAQVQPTQGQQAQGQVVQSQAAPAPSDQEDDSEGLANGFHRVGPRPVTQPAVQDAPAAGQDAQTVSPEDAQANADAAKTAADAEAARENAAQDAQLAAFQKLPRDQQMANGAVNAPGYPMNGANLDLPTDGRCQSVRYGDIVHFTLHIDNVDAARQVFTELQLALGHHAQYKPAALLMPTNDSLGGGGVAVRDADDFQLYHFSFSVPDVEPGIYRTTGIDVRAIYSASSADPGVGVALNHHARNQVKAYCLAVFGGGNGGQRPLVTQFQRDAVEHPATPPVQPIFR